MAIAYVGGATNTTGAGTATTLVVTYTSTTSNALYLAILAFQGTTNITSVTDSASNAWTLTGGAANTSGSMILAFTTSATPTGVTTVTIHATTATNICAVLGEYSGVTSTSGANFVGAVVASSPVTTGAQSGFSAANWMIGCLTSQTSSGVPVFTSNTGTLRNQATMTLGAAYGFAGVALVDQTGTTTQTAAANFTGTYLTALAVAEKAT